MMKVIRIAATLLTIITTALQSLTAAVPTMGIGDARDRRIEAVGQAYLDFYRNGADEDADGFSLWGGQKSSMIMAAPARRSSARTGAPVSSGTPWNTAMVPSTCTFAPMRIS